MRAVTTILGVAVWLRAGSAKCTSGRLVVPGLTNQECRQQANGLCAAKDDGVAPACRGEFVSFAPNNCLVACTPGPTCGNNVLDPFEDCDGNKIGTCNAATQKCSSHCRCIGILCGNGKLEKGERCDDSSPKKVCPAGTACSECKACCPPSTSYGNNRRLDEADGDGYPWYLAGDAFVPGTARRELAPACVNCEACGGSLNDPHMHGFNGESFYFEGRPQHWYALVHDPRGAFMNVRTAARYSGPEDGAQRSLGYSNIVSFAMTVCGAASHTIGIFNDNNGPAHGIAVVLDGEELPLGRFVTADGDVDVAVVQVPHVCKAQRDSLDMLRGMHDAEGGEKRPQRRQLAALEDADVVKQWLLAGDIEGKPTAANDFTNECEAWLQGKDLFASRLDGILTTVLIATPVVTLRVEHWGFDVAAGEVHEEVPDGGAVPLLLNVHFQGWFPASSAHGLLGQTARPVAPGNSVMEGDEDDYIVNGPFATSFKLFPRAGGSAEA